jgi:Uncharacterized protein involved in cytokinesis, contains TGc (transglutaminase/protease-like) domain
MKHRRAFWAERAGRYYRAVAAALAVLALCSCSRAGSGDSRPPVANAAPDTAALAEPANGASGTEAAAISGELPYIDQVAQQVIAQITEPGMNEYERAKAAFDYIIESTTLIEPLGLDLWRIRGDYAQPPAFVENRSLSVLLYGVGMCEDYAAALTVLLRGMGMEAEYVPGLTYSAAGTGLVDHAWTIAKIDGEWYHLDCQLEDNISRRDTTRYKYFMRSDATMQASHRWGQNLIDAQLLTPAQNQELARDFIAPICSKDLPTPAPRTFASVPMPDLGTIQAEIDAEFRAYENTHGVLPPAELNIIPPVFGEKGYGAQG